MPSAASEKTLLLDTASLYFRAFFGVPDSMRAPDGTPVNAVRGLLDFVARLVTDHRPTHLVACWDDDWRPQWRVDLLPTYKSHRVAEEVPGGPDVEEAPDALETQVPVIRAALAALGIAVVGAPGCEADDVIGTLTARSPRPVDVVTGDRDLFQLVDDSRAVRVLYTARGVGRLDIVDEAWVAKKYAIPGRAYADFAVLRGDPSDGLPGVPGVGDKTAAGLISKYTDLDGVLAAVEDESSGLAPGLRLKLRQAGDYLTAARAVVAVLPDAELPEVDATLPASPVDPDGWTELVRTWGLGGSAERVVAALAQQAG
ncbi:5'-3' exonuclease [Actinopolymorpha sp. NPDC004070]|uniref:5'-3' exonuclease n=1 Tax=Actinopolymorpha sp. NPDC004070 TaxID=3154548 RepID=UPI00339DB225